MASLDIHPLTVQSEHHAYPIYMGRALLSQHQLLNRHVQGNQVLLVTNETIAPLYLDAVRSAFTSIQCDVVVLPDGEMHKNQHRATVIYDALIQHHHHRDTTLFALGGGVIGDITGFVASTYQRGVRFIQLPTTLLAQVDAAVGGKTAINHGLAKNMIGSFYPPHAVIMDFDTLSSLPLREFRAGFGEIIKYGLLAGGELLSTLHTLLNQEEMSPSSPYLNDLVQQCCAIKATFVQEDERETGRRALLNLGHTFAHALESYTQYNRWLHGEAVAIGLYCAALLSYNKNLINQSTLNAVDLLLRQAQLPRRIPKDIDLMALHALMFHDKKVKNNTLHFVLMRALGDCYVDSQITDVCLLDVLRAAVGN